MRLLAVLFVVVSTIACRANALKTVESGNQDVTVEMIATFENTRLYRVKDGSDQIVYVAIQGLSSLSTTWSEGCGKNCVRDERVDTLVRAK